MTKKYPEHTVVQKKDGSYTVTVGGRKSYQLVCMPEGNTHCPWVVFIYKDKNGNNIGTTGRGHTTVDTAIEDALDFHIAEPYHGWLNPDGKFYEVAYSQHSTIVDIFYPEANGRYEVLCKAGWIMMRHGDFETIWMDFSPTKKQFDWIEAYCEKHKKPIPHFLY